MLLLTLTFHLFDFCLMTLDERKRSLQQCYTSALIFIYCMIYMLSLSVYMEYHSFKPLHDFVCVAVVDWHVVSINMTWLTCDESSHSRLYWWGNPELWRRRCNSSCWRLYNWSLWGKFSRTSIYVYINHLELQMRIFVMVLSTCLHLNGFLHGHAMSHHSSCDVSLLSLHTIAGRRYMAGSMF